MAFDFFFLSNLINGTVKRRRRRRQPDLPASSTFGLFLCSHLIFSLDLFKRPEVESLPLSLRMSWCWECGGVLFCLFVAFLFSLSLKTQQAKVLLVSQSESELNLFLTSAPRKLPELRVAGKRWKVFASSVIFFVLLPTSSTAATAAAAAS